MIDTELVEDWRLVIVGLAASYAQGLHAGSDLRPHVYKPDSKLHPHAGRLAAVPACSSTPRGPLNGADLDDVDLDNARLEFVSEREEFYPETPVRIDPWKAGCRPAKLEAAPRRTRSILSRSVSVEADAHVLRLDVLRYRAMEEAAALHAELLALMGAARPALPFLPPAHQTGQLSPWAMRESFLWIAWRLWLASLHAGTGPRRLNTATPVPIAPPRAAKHDAPKLGRNLGCR